MIVAIGTGGRTLYLLRLIHGAGEGAGEGTGAGAGAPILIWESGTVPCGSYLSTLSCTRGDAGGPQSWAPSADVTYIGNRDALMVLICYSSLSFLSFTILIF